MQSKKIFFSVAFITSLFSIHNVHADNRPGAIVLTPSVGAYLFNSNRGVENNPLYNIGLGYDFNRAWSVEALAGLVPTSAKGVSNQNINAKLYTIDGIYHLNMNNIPLVPYILAGGGFLDGIANLNTNDPNTQANVNAGAGLEYFLGNSVALRSDVRDIYTMNTGKSDLLVNVGVSLLLGGQTPVALTYNNYSNYKTDQCITNKIVIRFGSKNTTVDPIYKAELQQIVACMQNDAAIKINLDGYSNSSSNAKTDLLISQQRAENVKNYLVTQAGIDSSRLNAQGFGEANSALSTKQNDSVIVSVFSAAK